MSLPSHLRLTPLLLCLSFIATACSPHQPPASSLPKPVKVNKQHINLTEMQPQFLYLAAQDAIENNQQSLAIELLSALIKKDPQAIKPHLQLIELLLQSKQHDQGQQHITSLLQNPDLSSKQRDYLQLALVRLHATQGKNEIALAGVELFLKTHPSHIEAHDLQSKLLTSMKRYDDALAALEIAINIKDIPEFRLLQAQIHIKQGDFVTATASLKRMQTLLPDQDTPVLMLSALALRMGKHEQSETLLRNFLQTHPKALRIVNALGQLLVQDKRSVEAILMYRDAATHSNNDPNILHALGMLYFGHQDYSDAENTFRHLVKVNPDDRSRFYLAASLEALKRIPEARKLYLSIKPASALATEAQLRLAAMDVINNNIDQSVQRLQSILKQSPMQRDAILMLSTIRLSQNQFQLLIDETDAKISMPKTPAQLLFNRAVAFESLKQYEHVESMLQRVLRSHPNHAEAMNFLGYTYAVQNIELGKAEALIHRALILQPNNGYYLDSLAWVYYKTGNFAKAISTQAKALEKTPDDAIMHEHYGDMLWRHGDLQQARQAWKKALTLNSKHKQSVQNKINKGLTATE